MTTHNHNDLPDPPSKPIARRRADGSGTDIIYSEHAHLPHVHVSMSGGGTGTFTVGPVLDGETPEQAAIRIGGASLRGWHLIDWKDLPDPPAAQAPTSPPGSAVGGSGAVPTPLDTSLLDQLSAEVGGREYAIRLAGDDDAPDYFVTDDLALALRYRRDGVHAGNLPMEAQVYDDEGSVYELYYLDGGSLVQKDGRFYAEWIDGECVGEARP